MRDVTWQPEGQITYYGHSDRVAIYRIVVMGDPIEGENPTFKAEYVELILLPHDADSIAGLEETLEETKKVAQRYGIDPSKVNVVIGGK